MFSPPLFPRLIRLLPPACIAALLLASGVRNEAAPWQRELWNESLRVAGGV
ncbi:MAG TPA: hypothetical protein PK490_21000 [Prosthecobacter sp.]|nr:hypothetical protein [Prosthecobacter sp.]HRK16773.1 hypothetical protein [Prosthecobacter sp.]